MSCVGQRIVISLLTRNSRKLTIRIHSRDIRSINDGYFEFSKCSNLPPQ
jgi:hypothetical protein